MADKDNLEEEMQFEQSEEENNGIVMAPSSISGYFSFMKDKNNRKDKYHQMPSAIRRRIFRSAAMVALCLILGVTAIIMRQSLSIVLMVFGMMLCFVLVFIKQYLDGATRQYVQLKGVVIRSDYEKNLAIATRNALRKTMQADFNYRTFFFKLEEGDIVKVRCRKSKELPQKGDAVKVTVHVKTGVNEDEGITELMNYIEIERVA